MWCLLDVCGGGALLYKVHLGAGDSACGDEGAVLGSNQ